MDIDELKARIRDVPDFPKEGIIFKDITTLVKDRHAFRTVMDHLYGRYRHSNLDAIVGIESRGFIFGAALADRLGLGFITARKPGKLPAETISQSYDLEYGQATLEIHKDAINEGLKVLVIDDLLATGGTLAATCQMIERLGGKVEEVWVLIELLFLEGKKKLAGRPFFSLIQY